MNNPVVAIKRYVGSPDSLKEAVSLCNGLEGLNRDDHVFIKPNLIGWDNRFPMPLYGVFTTTRLVEDMVIILKDYGAKRITIGEGSVYLKGQDQPLNTKKIFQMLGYPLLVKRYGVKLMDIHKESFNNINYGDFELQISRPAMEADFFINIPALKTHNQSILSLGLKNLKGCISTKSRKFCHSPDNRLDLYLSLFVEKIKPSLTILDGIYGLERGPYHGSIAVRMNAIVTSRDSLAVDIVGANLTGLNPADIPHIKEYAERNGRSLSVVDLDIKGETIHELTHPLRWDNIWREDNSGPKAWDKQGIAGIYFPKYDKTLCTGCSYLYSPMLLMIMSAYQGNPFDNIEILTGKSMETSGKADKTILVGNCMIKANRKDSKIKEAIFAKGCPPSFEEVGKAFEHCAINVDMEAYQKLQHTLINRYQGKEEFNNSLFYLKNR